MSVVDRANEETFAPEGRHATNCSARRRSGTPTRTPLKPRFAERPRCATRRSSSWLTTHSRLRSSAARYEWTPEEAAAQIDPIFTFLRSGLAALKKPNG